MTYDQSEQILSIFEECSDRDEAAYVDSIMDCCYDEKLIGAAQYVRYAEACCSEFEHVLDASQAQRIAAIHQGAPMT